MPTLHRDFLLCRLQLEYLERFSSVDPTVAREFGRRLVELTAEHAPEKLLKLLQVHCDTGVLARRLGQSRIAADVSHGCGFSPQTNPNIPLKDATEICKARSMWKEYAFCLRRLLWAACRPWRWLLCGASLLSCLWGGVIRV